ncbi:hypothetical protein AcW1_005879 [Taiwanofungus camphoratus]|nr:hypothetical protein AcW2_004634 [Antrodia cinnamomea]KAI0934311.1 hypothetical protein AcV5_006195 [Antrodia cinnamomea]KAI0950400.1 hypothetical protein AcV7_008876 [Antrodia cinnamomea]KAI0957506.1 hypothetical protein AcW1_005879 [Antrodia cinnamomea]
MDFLHARSAVRLGALTVFHLNPEAAQTTFADRVSSEVSASTGETCGRSLLIVHRIVVGAVLRSILFNVGPRSSICELGSVFGAGAQDLHHARELSPAGPRS